MDSSKRRNTHVLAQINQEINMKKLIIAAICVGFIFACGEKKGDKHSGIDSAKLYKQHCQLCHGMDGKLGANGSKDLTASALTMDERKAIIKNGKGAMTPFGSLLSKEEIAAVAEYTFSLK